MTNPTRLLGFIGAKPPQFNRWILDLLGYVEGDQLDDLYPGTGSMASALEAPLLPLQTDTYPLLFDSVETPN